MNQPFDEPIEPIDDFSEDEDELEPTKPGFFTLLILFLLILAMLSSLVWPVIYSYTDPQYIRPTPTSPYLQEI